MCTFESSQKEESRWWSTDSPKAYRNTSAFKCYLTNWDRKYFLSFFNFGVQLLGKNKPKNVSLNNCAEFMLHRRYFLCWQRFFFALATQSWIPLLAISEFKSLRPRAWIVFTYRFTKARVSLPVKNGISAIFVAFRSLHKPFSICHTFDDDLKSIMQKNKFWLQFQTFVWSSGVGTVYP